MKYVLFSAILMILHNCTGQTKGTKNELQFVSYTATTRGSSFNCKISADSIKVNVLGTKNKSSTIATKEGDWRILSELVNQLSLDSIKSLKSPTDNRHTDRARIAEIEIKKDDKLYLSNSFDEGSPPKELKPLVDKISLLSQTVE
ncbi:hypothetical protein ACOCEA_04050 [Maribacter sp. CXY002]|uniref:hypothetical protein n=1 Tax=Maribacter luteocoastalis TaxID=3407671 RepID=UPI003B67B1E6